MCESRQPLNGADSEPIPCRCGHAKHWRECRADGCACRLRGPNPDPYFDRTNDGQTVGQTWMERNPR